MSSAFRTSPVLLYFTLGGIFLALMYYIWNVIYSVYQDMKKQQSIPIYITMQVYYLEAKRPDSQEFCARVPVGLKLGLEKSEIKIVG